MEEQLFSIDDFVIATKSNPRKEEEPKPVKAAPEYNVKVNFKNKHIAFDKLIAEEINLAHNSLAHAVNPAKGVVALIIVPGDQGVFGKGIKGKAKGSSFKNQVLVKALVDLNLTSGKYKLEKFATGPAKVGKTVVENCDWYKLNMIGEPQVINFEEDTKEVPMTLELDEQAPVVEEAVQNEVEDQKF